MKIDILCMKHVKTRGGLLSECSIGNPEQRRVKLKHAWQLVYVFISSDLNRGLYMTGKLHGRLLRNNMHDG